jgi:hypothetical protein
MMKRLMNFTATTVSPEFEYCDNVLNGTQWYRHGTRCVLLQLYYITYQVLILGV